MSSRSICLDGIPVPVMESSQDHLRVFPVLPILHRIRTCVLQRGDHGVGAECGRKVERGIAIHMVRHVGIRAMGKECF